MPTGMRLRGAQPKRKPRAELVTQFIGDRSGMVESTIWPFVDNGMPVTGPPSESAGHRRAAARSPGRPARRWAPDRAAGCAVTSPASGGEGGGAGCSGAADAARRRLEDRLGPLVEQVAHGQALDAAREGVPHAGGAVVQVEAAV